MNDPYSILDEHQKLAYSQPITVSPRWTGVGGQKKSKTCQRSLWTTPYSILEENQKEVYITYQFPQNELGQRELDMSEYRYIDLYHKFDNPKVVR